jgi:hypothetical protein
MIRSTRSSPVDVREMVMLDGLITGDLVGQSGLAAILLSVIWMIFTGRLVTRREVTDIKEERDYWRAAFNEEQRQTQELLETARLNQAVLNALPKPPSDKEAG